jgi:enoyl-[acyl-carrier protein] reductase I
MPLRRVAWKPNAGLAAGKGATVQQFIASLGSDKLEINVAAWGEGDLKVNGVEIAHIENRKSRHQAFLDLKKIAERHVNSRVAGAPQTKRT